MPATRAPALAALAVGLLAAAWFWPGIRLTLEWVDQGQIVYGAWRVARGELPYRDFDHVYGPSVFLLNGLLLRWFGEDLGAVRYGLLVVKALLATLLFVVSRRVAGRWAALTMTLWFVALWGAPLWIYATPYAGHYTWTSAFAGIAVLAVAGPIGWRRACLAGLCIGAGATFKQTTGLFAAIAALVALATAPAPQAAPPDGLAAPARWLRRLVVMGAAALVAGYLSRALATWTGWLLAAPPLLALAWEWHRDQDAERVLGAGGPRLRSVFAFAGGFTVPLALWVAYFAARGALGDLVHDMLIGLPPRIDWSVPLSPPGPAALALGAGLGLGALGVAARRPPLALLAAAAVGGVVTAIAVTPAWAMGEVQALQLLPVAAAWASAWPALRQAEPFARRLVWWFAALACLSLHPGADLPHALMMMPAVLPALALLVDAGWARAGDRPVLRGCVAALAAMPIAGQIARDVALLRRAAAARPVAASGFDRARGIWDDQPRSDDTRRIVARLDQIAPRGTPLLVLPSAQLVYVVADRPSALPRAEMILYLLAIDAIRPGDARALAPPAELLAALRATRPVVVRAAEPGWGRVAAAYPELAAWLAASYEPTAREGRLELLEPRDRPRRPTP